MWSIGRCLYLCQQVNSLVIWTWWRVDILWLASLYCSRDEAREWTGDSKLSLLGEWNYDAAEVGEGRDR